MTLVTAAIECWLWELLELRKRGKIIVDLFSDICYVGESNSGIAGQYQLRRIWYLQLIFNSHKGLFIYYRALCDNIIISESACWWLMAWFLFAARISATTTTMLWFVSYTISFLASLCRNELTGMYNENISHCSRLNAMVSRYIMPQ